MAQECEGEQAALAQQLEELQAHLQSAGARQPTLGEDLHLACINLSFDNGKSTKCLCRIGTTVLLVQDFSNVLVISNPTPRPRYGRNRSEPGAV